MKIRTLIADDEPLGRSLVRQLLAPDPEIQIIGECANGAETLNAIQRDLPDLLFLDVEMPALGGFEVLAGLRPDQLPVVIFVTAFDAFALKAFEAHALDYLLKPLTEERFIEAVQRAKTHLVGREKDEIRDRLLALTRELSKPPSKYISRLAVECDERVIFLKAEDIEWIEADGNYLHLHAQKRKYFLRGRISELEKKLAPEQFFRIHRSTMVNLDHVKEFQPLFKGEGVVVMKNGSRLAASRSGSLRLREFLAAQL
jgi:two-component system LytT family response regulator